jgi:hypothetical protein
MPAPGMVRCPWCGYEQRRPPAMWWCPAGHDNAVTRRSCRRCRYRVPDAEWDAAREQVAPALTWWVATCRRCRRWVWSESVPAAVLAWCRGRAVVRKEGAVGWPR